MEDWKIKLKLYFDANKIKIISAIVLILILIILIIGLNIDRKKAKQAETFVMNGTIVYETGWDIDTKDEKIYQIAMENKDTYKLYENNIFKKDIVYKSIEKIIDFDIKKDKISQDLLLYEDGIENEIGNNIFHTQKSYAEKYLRFLTLENKYSIKYYVKTADYFDCFLIDENNELYRMLYITSSKDIGTTIFSKVEENVSYPKNFEESLEFNKYNINENIKNK